MDSQKYCVKEKKQSHKNYKIYIYMKFALKNRVSFFCKVIVGYKNESSVTEDLKLKKIKE